MFNQPLYLIDRLYLFPSFHRRLVASESGQKMANVRHVLDVAWAREEISVESWGNSQNL